MGLSRRLISDDCDSPLECGGNSRFKSQHILTFSNNNEALMYLLTNFESERWNQHFLLSFVSFDATIAA